MQRNNPKPSAPAPATDPAEGGSGRRPAADSVGGGASREILNSRTELPELGTIAIIASNVNPDRKVVAIGTTEDEFCVVDPFSSSCGRFKADPERDYGVTREQVRGWWDAVQVLREEGEYDEGAHNPSDVYVEAYLAGKPLPVEPPLEGESSLEIQPSASASVDRTGAMPQQAAPPSQALLAEFGAEGHHLVALTKKAEWAESDDPDIQTLIRDSAVLADVSPLVEQMAVALARAEPANPALLAYRAFVESEAPRTRILARWELERRERRGY